MGHPCLKWPYKVRVIHAHIIWMRSSSSRFGTKFRKFNKVPKILKKRSQKITNCFSLCRNTRGLGLLVELGTSHFVQNFLFDLLSAILVSLCLISFSRFH